MTPSRPVRLEDLDAEGDGRRSSPSAARNRAEILPVLRRVLPARGRALEIASGTGEHAVHFARGLPDWSWQPTDRDAEGLASIDAWRVHAGLPNVLPPLRLDVERDDWPAGPFDAVVAINLLHITPWSAGLALLDGAARVLATGGVLCLYGAFFRDDRATAPSNLDFDARLRAQDPELGVRRLEAVVAAAQARGLSLRAVVEMPNQNLTVVLSW